LNAPEGCLRNVILLQEAFVPIANRKASTQIMSAPDDPFDLIKLQQLEPQVVGAVFDRYFSEIYRYVHYRLGDQALAEDIASDVFVRLLESAREEAIPDSLPDLGPGPASEVDQREQSRALQSAYAKLTAEQQHVLALRFGQGCSLEETAGLMDKNVNAVKALQFRALAALQREIGEVSDE
jgi:RNA polymerase sigma-70 factor (ECF subfamily)